MASALLPDLPVHAIDSQGCFAKDVHEIEMGPVRTQDSSNLCWAFTATALIQQHYCAHKPEGCKFSNAESDREDDRLSILDVAIKGNRGRFEDGRGGFIYSGLAAIQANSQIAPEKCAPYDKLVNEAARLKQTFGFTQDDLSPYDIIDRVIKRYQRPIRLTDSNACALSNTLLQAGFLQQNIDDLLAVLRVPGDLDAPQIYAPLVFPKECESLRVTVPPYKVKRWTEPFLAAFKKGSFGKAEQSQVLTKIKDVIESNHPIGVSLRPEKDMGHAVAVSGVRQWCCPGGCKMELKLFDSDRSLKALHLDSHKDDWGDAQEIVQLIWKDSRQGYKDYGKDGAPQLDSPLTAPRLDQMLQSSFFEGGLTWLEP